MIYLGLKPEKNDTIRIFIRKEQVTTTIVIEKKVLIAIIGLVSTLGVRLLELQIED